MSDRIERMVENVQRSIVSREEAPMVIDMAGFCLGVLDPSERRNPMAMLGAVYDWMRGVWKNGQAGEDRPAYLLSASLADTFDRASKPKIITGDQFAAATLAATLPAAFGMKTRFRVAGKSGAWTRIWAEADPGDGSWGGHLDLFGGQALGDVEKHGEYGHAEIFDAWRIQLPKGAQEASLDSAPPGEDEHFYTILPDSWQGIQWMLGRMRAGVLKSVVDPLVVQKAAEIRNAMAPEDRADPEARLAAVYAWLREKFIYRPDPVGNELIQSPHRMVKATMIPEATMGAILAPALAVRAGLTLAAYKVEPRPAFMAGDCDDASWTSASLVSSEPIGIPTQFKLGGTDGSEGMHHIWTQAQIRGVWGYDMDPTELDFAAVGDHASMDKGARLKIWGGR